MKRTAKKKKPAPRPVLDVEDLRIRLEEAEETLRAIRRGDIDGLVVDSARGSKQVYTLKGADESYRTLVEAMTEGALIVAGDGLILYANKRFAEIVKTPLARVIGSPSCFMMI
jgi:PAS domain-containing protein